MSPEDASIKCTGHMKSTKTPIQSQLKCLGTSSASHSRGSTRSDKRKGKARPTVTTTIAIRAKEEPAGWLQAERVRMDVCQLIGPASYTEWARNQEFALLDSDLWVVASSLWKKPQESDFDSKKHFRERLSHGSQQMRKHETNQG